METHVLSRDELEIYLDMAKVATVQALVTEGVIPDALKADEWCARHTIMTGKKSIFRTISDLFNKEKSSSGTHLHVVKKIV